MKNLIISGIIAASFLTAGAETWSYTRCVDYARAHNISLQKAKLAESTATIDLDEARAQWQPSLDFATTQGFTNTPWGEGAKNVYSGTYGLNASWTVWNGGQRENAIRRSRVAERISAINTLETLRSIETDLLQVYLNILYARESVNICEQALALSTEQASRGKALMEAGRASRVDYARLCAQQEQDRYALVNARGTYNTRRMELKKLLELGIDTDITPDSMDWTAEEVLATLPPIDESYHLACETDLKLRTLQLQQESADLDVAIAKSTGRPSIGVTAGVGTAYGAPGGAFGESLKRNLSESIGLTLSVPIFDRSKTRAAVARARVQQMEARLDTDLRSTELAQLVETWYIDTESSQSRFEAAVSQLESATLSANLTGEQFALGLVNTVELITAHNELTEAKHSLLQAKYMAILGKTMINYYRTATIVL